MGNRTGIIQDPDPQNKGFGSGPQTPVESTPKVRMLGPDSDPGGAWWNQLRSPPTWTTMTGITAPV